MSNPANLGLFPNLEEVFPLYKYVSHLDLSDSRRQKEYFFDKYFAFLRRIAKDRIGSCRGCQSPLMIAVARHLKRHGCHYIGSF